ncbi:C-type lectin domain family 17, member A-like [Platysternon megacephalum]|uniref:C-type lectin domain family 17, member A-like n=1 Tax=Platysternon megacephalum TaxID=55544 RepID=A0A4D9DNI1_9SAUR|nr:C-type lectin domain family 17, member A-like [Platysternon megacephalum]
MSAWSVCVHGSWDRACASGRKSNWARAPSFAVTKRAAEFGRCESSGVSEKLGHAVSYPLQRLNGHVSASPRVGTSLGHCAVSSCCSGARALQGRTEGEWLGWDNQGACRAGAAVTGEQCRGEQGWNS